PAYDSIRAVGVHTLIAEICGHPVACTATSRKRHVLGVEHIKVLPAARSRVLENLLLGVRKCDATLCGILGELIAVMEVRTMSCKRNCHMSRTTEVHRPGKS